MPRDGLLNTPNTTAVLQYFTTPAPFTAAVGGLQAVVPPPVEPPPTPRLLRTWIEPANDGTDEFKIMHQYEGSGPYCWLYITKGQLEQLGPTIMGWLVKQERGG